MGQLVIKIRDRYFLWSTVVDAPVRGPWTREEALAEVTTMLIEGAANDAKVRLMFADSWGVGVDRKGVTLASLLENNRAGPDETCLTVDEIYERYAGPASPAGKDSHERG